MRLQLFLGAVLFLAIVIGAGLPFANAAQKQRVYIGTYTQGKSEGIYLFELDMKSGELAPKGLVAETENPSFLALHPNGKHLYAVNEVGRFRGKESGAVSAFAIDAQTGSLSFLNQQPSRGGAPCHLIVDGVGKHVLVANYVGGSSAVLPLETNGRLAPASAFVQHQGSSVNPRRQKGPHAHSINLDPSGQFAVTADLGLDKVLIFRYDPEKGQLSPNDPAFVKVAPGSGPRHFAFHPSGRYAFVINELLSTVSAFSFDRSGGSLKEIHTLSTLPKGFKGNNSTAEVQVHPSGKFLYGSNRGHNSIAMFSIDQTAGRLTPLGHQSTQGKIPRNFGVDPTGAFLLAANQNSDTIVVFRIDPQSGKLTPTGHQASAPTPVCVKFLPIND